MFFWLPILSFAESKDGVIDDWLVSWDYYDDEETVIMIMKESINPTIQRQHVSHYTYVNFAVWCSNQDSMIFFAFPDALIMNDFSSFTFVLDGGKPFDVDFKKIRGRRVFDILDKFSGKNLLMVDAHKPDGSIVSFEFDISKIKAPLEEVKKVCSAY